MSRLSKEFGLRRGRSISFFTNLHIQLILWEGCTYWGCATRKVSAMFCHGSATNSLVGVALWKDMPPASHFCLGLMCLVVNGIVQRASFWDINSAGFLGPQAKRKVKKCARATVLFTLKEWHTAASDLESSVVNLGCFRDAYSNS